jgi:protein-tyrosine phosphatase
MTEIIKGKLYLGNINDANDISFLNSNGIDTIINVAYDGEIKKVIRMNKTVYNFKIRDDIDENISKYFRRIIRLIDSGKCVLVNCMAGVSRSVTIVIAYLMTKQKMTFQEAFEFVRSKRPIINPNEAFIEQLLEYNNYLYNKKDSIFNQLNTYKNFFKDYF